MCNYSTIRNREFIRLVKQRYDQLSASGKHPSLRRAVLDILAKPAPSYYVDYYNATSILGPALRGEKQLSARYRCSEQWADMLRDLLELRRRHPGRNFRELILDLCVGNAGHPRFYMTLRRAIAIVRPHLAV